MAEARAFDHAASSDFVLGALSEAAPALATPRPRDPVLPHERGQELSVMEERNRLARDLHDVLAQTLFSVSFTAEAAATLVDRDPDRARQELRRLGELASSAVAQLRSLVFELRPAELE